MSGGANHESRQSTAAVQKLQETALKVRTPNVAAELWQKVFSVPEKLRLGDDLETAYQAGGAVGMWSKIHSCSAVRAIIDIAHTLNLLTEHDRNWLLREAGEALDVEAAYEIAIRNNLLVFNAARHEIHWNGERIEFEWARHEAKWAYLWELACHAKAGLTLDYTVLGGRKSPKYLSKTKSEIAKLDCFPLELADAIISCGTGTQRLEIESTEIRLFERDLGGEFREWTPS